MGRWGNGDKLYLPGSISDYSSHKIGDAEVNKYRLYDSSLNPVATIENVEILEFDDGPTNASNLDTPPTGSWDWLSGDRLSSKLVAGESSIRIKINWALKEDLQNDQTVDWYTDGSYQLEWILRKIS